MDFKTNHREMQELARELDWLRRHNLRFKPGDAQEDLLLYAEGAICIIALERFLRIVLSHNGHEPGPKDTLYNLLEKATSTAVALVQLPDREDAVKRINRVRNTIMHGDYEGAAGDYGCSVQEYFKRYFASEVEGLFKLLDGFMKQIDYSTGRPVL